MLENDLVTVRARAGRGMNDELSVRKDSSLLMVMWEAYFAAVGRACSSLYNLVYYLRPGSGRSLGTIKANVNGHEVEDVRTSDCCVNGKEEIRFHL